jgi:hypothetical protein
MSASGEIEVNQKSFFLQFPKSVLRVLHRDWTIVPNFFGTQFFSTNETKVTL